MKVLRTLRNNFKQRRSSLWRLATFVFVLPGGFWAAAAAADTPMDYMVQQVCDNGSGGHTSADPITCPSTARKLKIGEGLPYHKWDGPTAATARQISDSYPIAEIGGKFRVVQTFFFDSQGANFVEPVFDGGAPPPTYGKTAYDLVGADGSYVAYAGTYDPGRGWQPSFHDSNCSLSDSWLIAPKALTLPFGQGTASSTLQLAAPQCPTVTSFGTALTVWNSYPNVTYESGKTLSSIKAWHFAGNSLNSTGIEEFYYTKQYGKTRWEAWSSTVSGPNTTVLAHCPTGTSNGVSQYAQTTYYLVDCHDWSNVVASPSGDWDPAASWHVDPLYYSFNLLKNTHMQCVNGSGIAVDCGAGGTCQTFAPWQLLGTLALSYDQALQGATTTANCAAKVSAGSVTSGESVYQDVLTVPTYPNYTFGTALWLPAGGKASATVTLFQVNAGGTILSQTNVTAKVDANHRFFSGSFARNPSTSWIRFQIYLGVANKVYEFSDAWVAPKP